MVRVAVVGYGFMGRAHVAHYRQLADARVVAVVESNPQRLQEFVKGNIQAGEEQASLAGVESYRRLEEILGRSDVDVVDICLPTHLHKEATLAALRAGHHVICEKPLALSLEDVDEMIGAAEKAGRYLMVAHCIRFWPEYEYLQELVRTEEFGKPVSAIFRRISPYPGWTGGDDWFSDPNRSGGALLDLHVHDVDIVNVLFGKPEALYAQALFGQKGGTLAVLSQYRYPDGPMVFLEGSWEYAAFEMSYHVAFEEAEVRYSSSASPTVKVLRKGKEQPEYPEMPPEDGYLRELRYFVECVRDGRAPERVSLPSVRETMALAFAELESIQKGNVVRPVP